MKNKYGIAIDIGTTTVALSLSDINTSERLSVASAMNAQRFAGADVSSRISYCASNGSEELTRVIREQIETMIHNMLEESVNIQSEDICKMTIAANTVMQHLAAGLSPVSLGTAPFTPKSLFGETLPYWDLSGSVAIKDVYYTPCISSYVGGDITAGLLAAGFEDIKEPALFIDIGTNGETALKHNGKYYCCATAAGPAFEVLESINLRGSKLIDLLADMLKTGEIDSTGCLVCDNGRISADDIRKLQLAKAAIAAGIGVLIHYAGISEREISLVALAGAFGTDINTTNAAKIGLFPKVLLPVAKAYGNTALDGAVLTLCDENACEAMEKLRDKCEYIELSSNAYFNDLFVEHMGF